MAKAFKITPTPGDPGIFRAPDGRFTRTLPPGPPRIVAEAFERGVGTFDVISEQRQPDHPVPKGSPKTVGNEIPWPPADKGKTPFRFNK